MDFSESEVNLDLALRIRSLLLERGYRVLMTRDGDYALNEASEDVNGNGLVDFVDEAQARVDMINSADAHLLLSIHQNTYPSGDDVGGTVTYYCSDRSFGDRSLRFARLVQESILGSLRNRGYDARDRGVVDDVDLITPDSPGQHIILLGPESDRIVRPCQVPGVLSETLFITHRLEAKLVRDPEVLDRLAAAYVEAIERYFEEEQGQVS